MGCHPPNPFTWSEGLVSQNPVDVTLPLRVPAPTSSLQWGCLFKSTLPSGFPCAAPHLRRLERLDLSSGPSLVGAERRLGGYQTSAFGGLRRLTWQRIALPPPHWPLLRGRVALSPLRSHVLGSEHHSAYPVSLDCRAYAHPSVLARYSRWLLAG